jgi:hypothetical protein
MSLLISHGDHLVEQGGVLWTAEETQPLLKERTAHSRRVPAALLPRQLGDGPINEFCD